MAENESNWTGENRLRNDITQSHFRTVVVSSHEPVDKYPKGFHCPSETISKRYIQQVRCMLRGGSGWGIAGLWLQLMDVYCVSTVPVATDAKHS